MGAIKIVTHAPSTNLAAITTTRATAVATVPMALTSREADALLSPACAMTRRQWTTMPACDSVKARNAPTANRGIRRSVMPPNAIEQQGGKRGQNHDAPGVDQPPSPVGKGVGQKIVLGQQSAQARKVGKTGIGGKRQHARGRCPA